MLSACPREEKATQLQSTTCASCVMWFDPACMGTESGSQRHINQLGLQRRGGYMFSSSTSFWTRDDRNVGCWWNLRKGIPFYPVFFSRGIGDTAARTLGLAPYLPDVCSGSLGYRSSERSWEGAGLADIHPRWLVELQCSNGPRKSQTQLES